ncbi:hypothetical protein OG241_23455 [Streptomyces sp. NBC_01390]
MSKTVIPGSGFAQARWRSVDAPYLVALVRAGAHFERGQLVDRHDTVAV